MSCINIISKMKRLVLALALSIVSLPVLHAQWQSTPGPVSGYIRTFLTLNQAVFAGSGGGGVIRSDDNGDSWTFQNEQLGSTDIKSLVFLNQKIFAGTDEGVFMSSDNGQSWSATGLVHTYVKALAVKGSTLFAGSYVKGMFRSYDGGMSWEQVNSALPDMFIYCLAAYNNTLFAGTYQHGIYYSADDGDSWLPANTGLPDMTIMSVTVAGSRMFAGTLSHGVYYSDNAGAQWNAIPTLTGHVKSMVVLGDTLFAGTAGGVYRSTDHGSSWIAVNNGLTETEIWGMGLSGTTVFAGTASGRIFRSTDFGANWTNTNAGMVFKALIGSITKSGSNLLCASHGSGLYRSADYGDSYAGDNSIGTVEIRSLAAGGNVAFAGTDLLGIFRSNNNGNSFTAMNTGMGSKWIQAIAVDGATIFAGTADAGIFRSTNNGNNWMAVNSGLGSMDITALLITGGEIYAGTYDSGVYLSTDNGLSWEGFNMGLISPSITCLGKLNNYLFAGTRDAGVFYYDSWDNMWVPFSLGLPDNAWITSLANVGSALLASTANDGVYWHTDIDAWEAFNWGLSNTQVRSLYVDDLYLYAGTNGGGVFRRPLTDISIGINEDISGDLISLYPNPARDKIILTSDPSCLPLQIQIISTEGKVIKETLLKNQISEVDISQLQPGFYLLKSISGGKVHINKIIIY
jgi:photosystem II stability/assembly factor-like uncharacterized protein